ncbi:MAG: ParB N-terminal domain-containing protein [Bacteroidaceae bacterium]
MKIKQSETREVMRSQLHAQPYNPKRHTDKQVDGQRKNIKTFGYLGGIVWNELTGNLIDGHRRLKALDQINKYDGTNDYPVKVEVVSFDEKQEKEQMTYMALGSTRPDYEMIAQYLPDIDYEIAGIEPYDLMQIQSFLPQEPVAVESIDDFIQPTYEEKKTAVKEAKKTAMEKAAENWQNVQAYITISFANAEEKRMFCDVAGLNENDMFITGRDILDMIQ